MRCCVCGKGREYTSRFPSPESDINAHSFGNKWYKWTKARPARPWFHNAVISERSKPFNRPHDDALGTINTRIILWWQNITHWTMYRSQFETSLRGKAGVIWKHFELWVCDRWSNAYGITPPCFAINQAQVFADDILIQRWPEVPSRMHVQAGSWMWNLFDSSVAEAALHNTNKVEV